MPRTFANYIAIEKLGRQNQVRRILVCRIYGRRWLQRGQRTFSSASQSFVSRSGNAVFWEVCIAFRPGLLELAYGRASSSEDKMPALRVVFNPRE
jgi:hypothetical protein